MKLKSKMLLGMGIIISTSMLVLAAIVSLQASSKAAASLEVASENQLLAIRDTKKTQIEDYFATLHKQVATFASNETFAHAMQEFSARFNTLQETSPLDIES